MECLLLLIENFIAAGKGLVSRHHLVSTLIMSFYCLYVSRPYGWKKSRWVNLQQRNVQEKISGISVLIFGDRMFVPLFENLFAARKSLVRYII